MVDTFEEFVSNLREIKQMGYIETHRAGNTGIGKTLALDRFHEEIKIEYKESINPVVPMIVVDGNTVTKYSVDEIGRF